MRVDRTNKQTNHRVNYLQYNLRYFIVAFKKNIQEHQSNFGMETIRTLSDEETRARGEINELLSLCDITHDFPCCD